MSIAPAAVSAMQSTVLGWYADNARDLAFRRTSDPWAILVSEVIAQQTQAARAAEAWARFISQFPTPAALAAASPATAIRAWRGLGYNRRAVSLRKAAISIVEDNAGQVPDTFEELARLPGIGPYTARAVLAIAFNQPVAALDTNIRRVVGRALLGSDGSPARDLQELADGLVPDGLAAAWTHALMDVGAAFCRKRDPRCGECPLRQLCTYASGRRAAGEGSVAGNAPAAETPAAGTRRPPAAGASDGFPATTRWLRGRIVDRLRDARDGQWVTFDGPLGSHAVGAVHEALGRLAREGMLELDEAGRRARLRSI